MAAISNTCISGHGRHGQQFFKFTKENTYKNKQLVTTHPVQNKEANHFYKAYAIVLSFFFSYAIQNTEFRHVHQFNMYKLLSIIPVASKLNRIQDSIWQPHVSVPADYTKCAFICLNSPSFPFAHFCRFLQISPPVFRVYPI